MFRRVLVANRGEIAVRVCRGLSEMGIEPVVVHSAADRQAAHVLAAPRAIDLGGETAEESYLRVDAVVAAALEAGCEAVHPGYGFLSENPELVRACEAAGIVFIGPGAAAMEALGRKRDARELAEAAGVPVVPGFHNDDGDDARLLEAARSIGFPLLVKASAGGGGKGMRLVQREEDLAEAIAAGRREARAAFGDAALLLEKRVFPARHVEIQILGDARGAVVSLHERECSVQRRHQKILEESPSPAVDEGLRTRMGEAAVALAERAGYCNAGTVEFLLDEEGAFYFLEMNTRLQVEHLVTEMVTGLDLVHLQVAVAAGATLDDLDLRSAPPPRGHAIEARIYAEDVAAGFLPAAGRLVRVIEPAGPGLRIDSGVVAGSEVSVHYDPLLAKLIVHAPDRESACRRLARALEELVYLGVTTNVDFLRRVVESERFRAGALRNDFLDLEPHLIAPPPEDPPDEVLAAAVLAELLAAENGAAAPGARGVGAAPSPWETIGPLRLWEGRR